MAEYVKALTWVEDSDFSTEPARFPSERDFARAKWDHVYVEPLNSNISLGQHIQSH